MLASYEDTTDLPPLIILHQIIVRSPLTLPHTLHGWHEAEYVKWAEEHTEEEAWSLVEGALGRWEADTGEERDEEVEKAGREAVRLVRSVREAAVRMRQM